MKKVVNKDVVEVIPAYNYKDVKYLIHCENTCLT